MADFATYALAESRARTKVADGTWVEAFACRATTGGKIAVRVLRKMSPASAGSKQYGGWTEITDDGTV
jgi:hypothetical protein